MRTALILEYVEKNDIEPGKSYYYNPSGDYFPVETIARDGNTLFRLKIKGSEWRGVWEVHGSFYNVVSERNVR